MEPYNGKDFVGSPQALSYQCHTQQECSQFLLPQEAARQSHKMGPRIRFPVSHGSNSLKLEQFLDE
jgi:hypothetical protein